MLKGGISSPEGARQREKHRDILGETDRRGRDGREQGGQRGREREPAKVERDKASLRAKGIEGTRGGLPWQSSG